MNKSFVCLILAMFTQIVFAQDASWELGITFNDISMSDKKRCRTGDVKRINESLLSLLDKYNINAVGFVHTGIGCGQKRTNLTTEIANLWLAKDHQIGNYSHTKPDLNIVQIDTFIADIERADKTLTPLLEQYEQSNRWLRTPYFHLGNKSLKKSVLEEWIKDNQYRHGVATILSKDWVYAKAYEVALLNAEQEVAKQVAQEYLQHLRESVDFYQALGQTVINRQISQVLVLHVSQLNVDYFSQVLDLLTSMGAEIVSVDQALSDPVYRRDDFFVGNPGVSWLFRWAFTEWVDADIELIPMWSDWIWEVASGNIPEATTED